MVILRVAPFAVAAFFEGFVAGFSSLSVAST